MRQPTMKGFYLCLLFLLFVHLSACKREHATDQDYTLDGNLRKWHPVTLTFNGPEASETDSINPFLNYSLLADFKNADEAVTVYGYFAADGNAANSSAEKGNKWQLKFSPYKTGTWDFDAYLYEGKNIAVVALDSVRKGNRLWHVNGEFEVRGVDSTATGFLQTGKLGYVKSYFLEEQETGKAFLKNGVGSPENFLAYHEFDGTFDNGGAATPSLKEGMHQYVPHLGDWQPGDPVWAGNKGKAIIGALNYLSSMGMNSLYFLTMNVQGDGNDVWPWMAPDNQTRYDISKLSQWDKVFDHMDKLGIAMNVFTQETENDTLLNHGDLGLERKLYYRELVARFGHHLGIVWNLGEETNRSTKQLKQYASYIRSMDPYHHPIAVHNHVRVSGQTMEGRPEDPIQETFSPLLGFEDFEAVSLQLFDTTEVHQEIIKWRKLSGEHGKPWVVNLDETGHWEIGVTTDTAANNNHKMLMRSSLWGSYMAGGAGTSWYFGNADMAHNDLAAEDFRAREKWWQVSNTARQFFTDHVPFSSLSNHDELLSNPEAYCLAKVGEIYVVYLPKYQATELEIGDGNYIIAFFDPYGGGKLLDKKNQGWEITKANSVSLSAYDGQRHKDWVILIKKK